MNIELPTAENPVVVIHGDCESVMPHLSGIDAVITDPPYGIDFGKAGGFNATHGWGPWRENVSWDVERPPRSAFDAILSLNVPTMIWGGNYFTDYLPPKMGWVSWDKGQRDFSLADFELAWTSEEKASRCIQYGRGAAVRDGKVHPTQKPIYVMRQCIDYLQRGRKKRIETILDCFAGSGTTGVAAILEGRRAILIEKDAKYVDICRRRVAEAMCRPVTLSDGKRVGQNLFAEVAV